MTARKTIVGSVDPRVLAFTVGKDLQLDLALAEADCIGTAGHVSMLSGLPVSPAIISKADCGKIIPALLAIIRDVRRGSFGITMDDQDVHLAVERRLTRELGDAGKRVHTGRSRNDQVAVDLRLHAKVQLLDIMTGVTALADALFRFGQRHMRLPMVGRTHMQPAMPSSVGLWASAYGESLVDDMILLRAAYDLNNRSPLGFAASFGVPLPIDREKTAKLLGFPGVVHNVLSASNARGKCESTILAALAQVMLTLSRLAEDMILYSTPEFGYFSLPVEYCTGSSIMPQKNNPDVLELVRAKSATVMSAAFGVATIVRSLPAGYNRDLQETKGPFLEGMSTTGDSVAIMLPMVAELGVNADALRAGFTPGVFATDKALELVATGTPFREAYKYVREHLDELEDADPDAAVRAKRHTGATAGLDFAALRERSKAVKKFVNTERRRYYSAISKLLGVSYPSLEA